MGKNSITNSLRSILRKFEVVEIVDLVTIAQKLLLIWRKKKKEKKKEKREGEKESKIVSRKFIAGHPFGRRRIPTRGGGGEGASIGPNVNVRCG